MSISIGPNRSIMSKSAQHFVLRRMPAVLAVLLAVLMLSNACSQEGANSGNSTPTEPSELEKALVSGKPTLAGFVGDDCCQTITPTLEELAVDYAGTYNILIIEVGEHKDVFNQYEITLTPTQMYFDSTGTEVERIVGRSTKEEMVDRLAGMGGV